MDSYVSNAEIEAAEKLAKSRRNTWNERKNAILVEIVKECKYPTPWRPKHGTNKEIWMDIASQMMARTDIFDTPVHWESAKEQLLKIIDRQRLRRSLGDYTIKNESEVYVDEMIKHITADDDERANAAKKQKERASKRQFRRSGTGDDSELNESGGYDDEADSSLLDVADKRLKLGDGVSEALSMRLVAELQTCKSLGRTSSDLLAQPTVEQSEALALVQQQLASCQAVLSTAQAILIRVLTPPDASKK